MNAIAGRLSPFTRSILTAVAIIATLASACALAQGYPNKPIKLIVGFAAGTGSDFTARLVAQHMSEGLGQLVIVENRLGLGSNLAASEVAKAAPNGYTLYLSTTSSHSAGPYLMERRLYDPINDFTAIGQIVESYFVAVVPPQHPANTVKEFVIWAKSNFGKVNYSSPGVGSSNHLFGAYFNQTADLKMTHVPYKGPLTSDLATDLVQFTFSIPSTVGQLVQAGKLKALAVTSPERLPTLPNVQTMYEAGFPEFQMVLWQGLSGPAALPKEIIARLSAELKRVLAKAEVRERFTNAGTPATYLGPDAFAERIRSDIERWRPIVKSSGATMD
jgi:tripartite-type tricarboxylate transporter receptor subunit TctC